MPSQLPADCLNEIFEYLEDDKITLRSCLLVNHLWCEIAVRILWRNVWSCQYNINFYNPYRKHVPLAIISTLVGCLPDESKDLLYKNGIFIAAPTWKPSLFNYASFCKVLSVHRFDKIIQYVLQDQRPMITSRSLGYNKYLLSHEILKMFMKEISSLKSLDYDSGYSKNQSVMFINLPEARNCLQDLLELKCSSNIYPEFFYQLSQICRNIQSIAIEFGDDIGDISDGLTDLISLQNNLKSLELQNCQFRDGLETFTSSLTKVSSTLTKLKIKDSYMPLSFVSRFTNLRELILSFDYAYDSYDYFYQLQYVSFSQLKVLKFLYKFPEVGKLVQFLETNGENLEELYIWDNNNELNLAIAKFCPNLKTMFTIFLDGETETLKEILNSCQYLESINAWRGDGYLKEKDFLGIIAKHLPENFHKLEMYYVYNAHSELLSEELEEFLINWENRTPLSLIILKDFKSVGLEINEENVKIIERYMEKGFIKKFIIKKYEDED